LGEADHRHSERPVRLSAARAPYGFAVPGVPEEAWVTSSAPARTFRGERWADLRATSRSTTKKAWILRATRRSGGKAVPR